MQSQKNSRAEASCGRFQNTSPPTAKISISWKNQINDQMYVLSGR